MYKYWLLFGVWRGWVSEPYCATHDTNYKYMTKEEKEEWELGNDPCHVTLSVL
jgi:hypothetical protein